ncbi:hypothetical protein M3629_11475 [Paenibacillus polysaccharolyticus]|uniref:hypothetical protein n=1 Tax=Paenibacillus polysaccharolyticus TaxID=582692 RepID=UPI00203E03AB|nr:hypothetical protein [Paenibacillus polysaccharolyticus]MCM3133417.1 hypothetical protein [Paenibacillus polysaccharolyticus]
MRKTKKFVTGFIAMSLLLSVPVTAGASAVGVEESQKTANSVTSQSITGIETPEEYIAYLNQLQDESFSVQSLRSTAVVGSQDVNQFLNKYVNLPKNKQQQFLDYLNNPEFIRTVFSAMNGDLGSELLYNGDLVVTSSVHEATPAYSTSEISIMAVGDTKDHSLYHEHSASLFGLDFIKTRVEMSYRTTEVKTNSSQITKILNSNGILVQNFYPGADITKSEHNPVIASDKLTAKFNVDWSWNFIWDKLGLTIGVKRQWMEVNKAGSGYGGTYNL